MLKMPTLRLPNFEPHAGQNHILQTLKKYNIACMGRRYGKTALMKEWIINRAGGALAGEQGNGKLGLPTAWYAPNDSYFIRVYQDIVNQYNKAIRKASTQPRPVIEFRNGGRIDFWTLEKPMQCGRSNYYARVVIDEAAHARWLQEAWEESINLTLADMDGDAFFISTPKGLNYFYKLFNDAKKKDDWAYYTAPSLDNPFLPKRWMEQQEKKMPELVYRQEVLAEFITFGTSLLKPEHILYAPTPNFLPIFFGVDLALSEKESADYTSIVIIAHDKESKFIYVKEALRFKGSFYDILARIKNLAVLYHPIIIAIENTQFQAAVVQELARTTNLPVRGIKPDKDKITRFLPVLTKYEQNLIRHDMNNMPGWFIDELSTFPHSTHDDGVDALVYAINALELNKSFYGRNECKSLQNY